MPRQTREESKASAKTKGAPPLGVTSPSWSFRAAGVDGAGLSGSLPARQHEMLQKVTEREVCRTASLPAKCCIHFKRDSLFAMTYYHDL